MPELTKEIGSGEKILAYGKAAMVGLNGEIEHASAFIHTLRSVSYTHLTLPTTPYV